MAVESDDSVSDIIRAAASSLGYAEIRLLQETAVRAFVTGSDVFLSISTSISTGGGKSLCYAVLPRVLDMLRGNDTSQSLIASKFALALSVLRQQNFRILCSFFRTTLTPAVCRYTCHALMIAEFFRIS